MRWSTTVLAGRSVLVLTVFAAACAFDDVRETPDPARDASETAKSPDQSADPAVAASNAALPCEGMPDRQPRPDEALVHFTCDPNAVELRGVVRPAGDTGPAERLTAALDALFAGPNPDEIDLGFGGTVPEEWSELPFSVELEPDGLAVVSFDRAILRLGAPNTSAQLHSLSESLRATGLQFTEVTAIELAVEGRCGAIAVWLAEVADCVHLAEPMGDVADCPILAPASLPSGGLLTPPRPYRNLGGILSWGSAGDTVTLSVSHRSSIGIEQIAAEEGAVPMRVGARAGWAFPDGRELEPGVRLPAIAWDDGDGCVYVASFSAVDVPDLTHAAALFSGERPIVPDTLGWWTLRSAEWDGGGISSGESIFVDAHSLSGRTPCAAYGAEIVRQGESLTVPGLKIDSEVGCVGDAWASEEAYLGALRRVASAGLEGERLVLTGPGVELRFGR